MGRWLPDVGEGLPQIGHGCQIAAKSVIFQLVDDHVLGRILEFANPDDETAFRRLLAGILGIPPVEVEGFIEAESARSRLAPPPSETFAGGHAVVVGVASYPNVSSLPATVLDDARDLRARPTDPATCGYPAGRVALLLDSQATRDGICAALTELAQAARPADTAVVFFAAGIEEDFPIALT